MLASLLLLYASAGGAQTPLCVGDCNADRSVTVDEILTLVNIALGNAATTECTPGDVNSDSAITIDEVLEAVNRALAGCPMVGGAVGEIVYFSCRQPPSWTISANEVDDIRRRLDGLTAVDRPSPFPRFGNVGYEVHFTSASSDLPDAILVEEGVVQVERGEAYTYFRDDKQLATMLKASSIAAGAYAELGFGASP